MFAWVRIIDVGVENRSDHPKWSRVKRSIADYLLLLGGPV